MAPAPAPAHSQLPADLPADFWDAPAPAPHAAASGPSAPRRTEPTQFLPAPNPSTTWAPVKLQFWYDSIIDIMISQPGVKLYQIAQQLHKNPVTIGLVTRSDMFKLRYEERRKSLAAEMDARITSKLGKVAEAGLDLTLEMLETKRAGIGVQNLKEITLGALDRLGYSPQSQNGPSVVVNTTAAAQVTSPVSAADLAAARATMRAVESGRNSSSPALSGPQAPEEGEAKDGEILPALRGGAGGLDAL